MMAMKNGYRLTMVLVVLLGTILSASGQTLDIDPAYPRWFKYGDEYVALSGNGLWILIANPELGVVEHNDHARRWGANANRTALTAFCHTGLCPWERTGPGRANDGKPRFNLDRFNEAYWERAVEYVEDARKKGMPELMP